MLKIIRDYFLRLTQPEDSVSYQWLKAHRYELRRVWVEIPNRKAPALRYAWFADDDRRVSSHYRSQEMATVNFGYFDPIEESRS